MKKYLAYATLLATMLVAACGDRTSTAPPLQKSNAGLARSLGSDIDQMIIDFFPTGLETAAAA